MRKPKVAVVFYTTYGLNQQMAEVAAEAAQENASEVRILRARETAPPEVVEQQPAWKAQVDKMKNIPIATPEDLVWADAVIFSTPTRYGGAASQMRAFIDTLGPVWSKGLLANKVVTAMTSAQNEHGGQETTIMTMYTTFAHWGAIIVPPGYTDPSIFASGGNPYGASIVADNDQLKEEEKAIIRHQARRAVDVAAKLLAGEALGDRSNERAA
jgi:NAD(P)H dehydrogenase (quinone)